MHPRQSVRVLALLTLPLLAGAGLSAVPAAADERVVVLSLKPAAPLDTSRPPASGAERAARTAATTPRPAAVRLVQDWLTGHGFQVEDANPWTVTARGPAHLLARRLPAALRSTVLSATVDAAGAMRPRAVPVGYAPAPLRDAYDVPDGADGRGTTVASVQFSGWRAADADVFARGAGIPLVPGQITTEVVAGAVADRPDGDGGDFEVALDVETVLGAAPAARQRVFVGPNTTSGAIAVYDAVARAAERDGLTAVSISWGACEPRTATSLLQALELRLARMVAAGATVTAAAGDAGAYGCASPDAPDDRLAVDYPASSPVVLGIGGTTLRLTGGAWSETAWSDDEASADGYAGSGTGGGLSTRFGAPAWQRGRTSEGRRAVPDLAVVADPRTGVGVYGPAVDGRRSWQVAGGTSIGAPLVAGQLASTLSGLGRTAGVGQVHVPLYAATAGLRDVVRGSNHRYAAGPGYDLVSGLGAPQWAALGPRLLVPTVTAAPATRSLDVPVAAYAPVSSAARYGVGETAEQACAQATSATLPATLRLADGPDRATAVVLGVQEAGECRATARPIVLDRTAPAPGATLARTSRPGVLQVGWRASDAGSGVAVVTWRVRRSDTGQVVASGTAARSGSVLRPLPGGSAYRVEVTARDVVGNESGPAISPDVAA